MIDVSNMTAAQLAAEAAAAGVAIVYKSRERVTREMNRYAGPLTRTVRNQGMPQEVAVISPPYRPRTRKS